jgi:hypothetical protein
MVKSLLHYLNRVATSRLGLFLSLTHLCLVVYAFAQKPQLTLECHDEINFAGTSLIANRSVHLYYESLLLKIIILLDLPGMLLSTFLRFLLFPLNHFLAGLYTSTQSWIGAIILLIGTSIQW